MNKIKELEYASLQIRLDLLKLCTKETIHIGGDLSICDMMTALWQHKITYFPNQPDSEKRDRFVLSKGHASAVTTFNQAAIGCFSKEDVFAEYAADGGRFSMHSCKLVNPYVDVSTGSLGHGMPIACGIAAALRLKGNNSNRVYTVMGDGEQSEGSIWEAVMNAVHYKLGNLIAIVDYNKLEADGFINDLTSLCDIGEKYKAFGWNVKEFNGNDMSQIIENLDTLPPVISSIPTVLICHTIKGKGVDFMENNPKWHAGKITSEQFEKIKNNLINEFNQKWSKA